MESTNLIADDELLELLSAYDADEEKMAEVLQSLTQRVKSPGAATNALHLDDFLALTQDGSSPVPILDARSPAEFAQGHITGAHNVPLFSHEERAVVGTAYCQRSRDAAISIGMKYVSPKMASLVADAKAIVAASRTARDASQEPIDSTKPDIAVHCWRGGMRSGALAWLLRRHGLNVVTLKGGYKAFRSWVVAYWGDLAMPTRKDKRRPGEAEVALETVVQAARALPGPRICVIGGRTGVGKTRVLHTLREMGHQILDLEGLAHHRGSTFGWVGQTEQPTSEHFANVLALAWRSLAMTDNNKVSEKRGWMFLEDEDGHIGSVGLPSGVSAALRCAPLVARMAVGEKARIRILVEDYCSLSAQGFDPEGWMQGMEASVKRLQKRLGGTLVNDLLVRLHNHEFESVARTLMEYYDKLYDKHVANSSGSGSGVGTRAGRIMDVYQDDDLDYLDATGIAWQVLARVAEFEVMESCGTPPILSSRGEELTAQPHSTDD